MKTEFKEVILVMRMASFLLHKTGKRMHACMQIHLPVVRTWSTKCGMFGGEIE